MTWCGVNGNQRLLKYARVRPHNLHARSTLICFDCVQTQQFVNKTCFPVGGGVI